MPECQYILESDLPPQATRDEVEKVRKACDQRSTAGLGYSAKQSLARWQMVEAQLRGSIIRHIKDGKRMFHKFNPDCSGDLLEGHIQANVTLPIGVDAYVEVILMEQDMIIIYAHEHTPGKYLLPQ